MKILVLLVLVKTIISEQCLKSYRDQCVACPPGTLISGNTCVTSDLTFFTQGYKTAQIDNFTYLSYIHHPYGRCNQINSKGCISCYADKFFRLSKYKANSPVKDCSTSTFDYFACNKCQLGCLECDEKGVCYKTIEYTNYRSKPKAIISLLSDNPASDINEPVQDCQLYHDNAVCLKCLNPTREFSLQAVQYSNLNQNTCFDSVSEVVETFSSCGIVENCRKVSHQTFGCEECIEGFFPDKKTFKCVPCNYPCKTCSSLEVCQLCAEGLNQVEGRCEPVKTLVPYCRHYVGGNCVYCEDIPGEIIFSQAGKCVAYCSVGYFPQHQTKSCEKCSAGCAICSNDSVCTDCYYEYSLKEGKCQLKNKSTESVDVFVKSYGLNSEDYTTFKGKGTFEEPFFDLVYVFQLVNSGFYSNNSQKTEINIFLLNETHFILNKYYYGLKDSSYGYLKKKNLQISMKPLFCSEKYTDYCFEEGQKAFVKVKSHSFDLFRVENSLEIQDVSFSFEEQFGFNLLKRESECDKIDCSVSYKVLKDLLKGEKTSLFAFVNGNSFSLSSKQQIVLKRVEFINFNSVFYRNIVEVREGDAEILVDNCLFEGIRLEPETSLFSALKGSNAIFDIHSSKFYSYTTQTTILNSEADFSAQEIWDNCFYKSQKTDKDYYLSYFFKVKATNKLEFTSNKSQNTDKIVLFLEKAREVLVSDNNLYSTTEINLNSGGNIAVSQNIRLEELVLNLNEASYLGIEGNKAIKLIGNVLGVEKVEINQNYLNIGYKLEFSKLSKLIFSKNTLFLNGSMVFVKETEEVEIVDNPEVRGHFEGGTIFLFSDCDSIEFNNNFIKDLAGNTLIEANSTRNINFKENIISVIKVQFMLKISNSMENKHLTELNLVNLAAKGVEIDSLVDISGGKCVLTEINIGGKAMNRIEIDCLTAQMTNIELEIDNLTQIRAKTAELLVIKNFKIRNSAVSETLLALESPKIVLEELFLENVTLEKELTTELTAVKQVQVTNSTVKSDLIAGKAPSIEGLVISNSKILGSLVKSASSLAIANITLFKVESKQIVSVGSEGDLSITDLILKESVLDRFIGGTSRKELQIVNSTIENTELRKDCRLMGVTRLKIADSSFENISNLKLILYDSVLELDNVSVTNTKFVLEANLSEINLTKTKIMQSKLVQFYFVGSKALFEQSEVLETESDGLFNCNFGSNIKFRKTKISSNKANKLICLDRSKIEIEDSEFSLNEANKLVSVGKSHFTVKNSLFAGNRSRIQGDRMIETLEDSHFEAELTEFKNNSYSFILIGKTSKVDLIDVKAYNEVKPTEETVFGVFKDSTVSIKGITDGTAKIENFNSEANGSALRVEYSTLSLENVVIANNSARNGSVYLKPLENLTKIDKVTFIFNTAKEKGGALFIEGKSENVQIEAKCLRNTAIEGGCVFHTDVGINLENVDCTDNSSNEVVSTILPENKSMVCLNSTIKQPIYSVQGNFSSLPIKIECIKHLSVRSGVQNALPAFSCSIQDIYGNKKEPAPFEFVMTPDSPEIPLEMDKELNSAKAEINLKNFLFVVEPGSILKVNTVYSDLSCQMAIPTELCEIGEYIDERNRCVNCSPHTFSFDRPKDKDMECEPCPKNMECNGSGKIFPTKGFFRSSERDKEVFPCLNPKACIDHLEVKNCAANYTGYLCASCAPNYHPNQRSVCFKCDSVFLTIVKELLNFVIFLLLVATLAYSSNKKEKNFVCFSSIWALFVELGTNVTIIASLRLDYPFVLAQIYDSVYDSLSLGRSIRFMSCNLEILNASYQTKLFISNLVPFVYLPLYCLLTKVSLKMMMHSDLIKSVKVPVYRKTVEVFMLFSLFPGITMRLFDFLFFDRVNERAVLQAYLDIEFFSFSSFASHGWFVFIYLGLYFYFVLMPVVKIVIHLYEENRELFFTPPDITAPYRVLFASVKHNHYLIALENLIFKVCVLVGLQLVAYFNDIISSAALCCIFFVIEIFYLVKFKPFINPNLNFLHYYGAFLCILSIYAGLLLTLYSKYTADNTWIVSLVLAIIILLLYCVFLYKLFKISILVVYQEEKIRSNLVFRRLANLFFDLKYYNVLAENFILVRNGMDDFISSLEESILRKYTLLYRSLKATKGKEEEVNSIDVSKSMKEYLELEFNKNTIDKLNELEHKLILSLEKDRSALSSSVSKQQSADEIEKNSAGFVEDLEDLDKQEDGIILMNNAMSRRTRRRAIKSKDSIFRRMKTMDVFSKLKEEYQATDTVSSYENSITEEKAD